MDDETQLCSFYLGGMCYGLPIEHVVEVSRCPSIVPVPSSPPAISGLMNIRSQIVTALNLTSRLGLSPPDSSGSERLSSMLILVRDAEGELIGLVVDTIEDVIEVAQNMFEPSPRTLSPAMRAMVPGAYKSGKRLVMLLDLEPILNLRSRPLSVAAL